MKLVVCGPAETEPEQEDYWYKSNRLRVFKTGEVVWTRGTSTIFRRFEKTVSTTRPTQSIFTTFDSILCACTLATDIVLVNGEDGSAWDVSLPFVGSRIWPNPLGGFYVERWMSKKSMKGVDPVLFTCSHPLDELKPVEIDFNEEIVGIPQDASYVVTYSSATMKHTLWKARRDARKSIAEISTIDSEIILEPIWSMPGSKWPHKAHKAFVSDTVNRQTVLCVHLVEIHTVYGVSLTASAAELFEIRECLDVTSLTNSAPGGVSRDLVVLTEEKSLELYRGGLSLTRLRFQISVPIKALQFASSADNSFDILLVDETRIRAATPLDRPLASAIFVALIEAAADVDATFASALQIDVCNGGSDKDEVVISRIFDRIIQELTGARAEAAVESARNPSLFTRLLMSDYHAKHGSKLFKIKSLQNKALTSGDNSDMLSLAARWAGDGLTGIVTMLIQRLHQEYEVLKLSISSRNALADLGGFLGGLCRSLFGWSSLVAQAYEDHYRRDLGGEYVPWLLGEPAKPVTQQNIILPPPNIMDSLLVALDKSQVGSDHKSKSLTPWTHPLCKFFLEVFHHIRQNRDVAALQLIMSRGWTLNDVEILPVGLQIVIRELIHRCRENPPIDMSLEAYQLIGREDIYSSLHPAENTIAVSNSSTGVSLEGSAEWQNETSDFAYLQHITRLRFSHDRRVREVYRLLESSSPVLLQVKRKPEMTDHDLIEAQQTKLQHLVCKAMAGTLGRGALTMFTRTQYEDKSVKVPDLVRSGRIPTQQVLIQLDEKHPVNASWAAFHNGVAAGLMKAPRRGALSMATRDLLRSWILFNKPKPLTDAHAGLVLALGLNGDLSCLTVPDTYEYLGPRHNLTSVATLIGLGCAKAGTCDPNVRRTLTLHVPSLYPQEISDTELVGSLVPASALIGLGMLYRGTCNRLMCEFFLEELSKSPLSNAAVDERDTYTLCAGLGLGLVALGAGTVQGGLAGLSDMELEERLYLLASGGPLDKLVHSSSAFDDELDHQWHTGGSGRTGSRTRAASKSARSRSALGLETAAEGGNVGGDADGEARCSRVMEGLHVNTDATGPGSCLAFGLIYLQSNDESIGSRLSPPATRFLLESVRPDLLMFKEWSRLLVMWDSVGRNWDFITSQLPTYMSNPSVINSLDVQDAKFMAKARAYIVAGTCLGIGCRYAGTANREVRDTLTDLLNRLSLPSSSASELLDQVDPDCADSCMSCTAIALGLVMAGTGDLESLKSLRSFRRGSKRYGSHQFASLALGFLFLGAGKVSFSRTKEAVAALVCSIIPVLSRTPDENCGYLQALRHFYVLAVEPRFVEAVDADLKESCLLPLVVTINSSEDINLDETSIFCSPSLNDVEEADINANSKHEEMKVESSSSMRLKIVAPCWLPPLFCISSIQVASPRYWPLELNGTPSALPIQLVVKLRADQLPYHVDPLGLSSLTARPRPRNKRDLVGSLRDFSSKSPFALAFVKHVPEHFELVYECLVRNCLDAIPSLLDVSTFQSRTATPMEADQIRFLKRYYQMLDSSYSRSNKLLWDRLLLIDSTLNPSHVRSYVTGTKTLADLDEIDGLFGVNLNLAGIPRLGILRSLDLSTNMTMVAAVMDPDAVLELCDALF